MTRSPAGTAADRMTADGGPSVSGEEERMSAGGLVIAPAAVAVAAGAVVVLTAAGAAVLAVRGANAAAEGALRALGDYGGRLEKIGAAQADAAVSAAVWQDVAADVVEVNARIRMLTERAARAGKRVAVPKPFTLAGANARDADAWVARTARQLASVQAAVNEACAADEWKQVSARLAKAAPARAASAQPDTAAAMARFQLSLRDLHSQAPAPVSATVPHRSARQAPTAADVDRVLRGLDPDAYEAERLDVLEAAARVVRQDAREADAYMRALKAKVAAANKTVAARRLAAQWLEALEEPIVAGVEPPQPFAGTAKRLREVVEGRSELAADLRDEGRLATDWAAAVTRNHYVRTLLCSAFAGQGYTVEGEFDDWSSSDLRLSRPEWHGEHSAEVWMDARGAVHGRVMRQVESAGDEARLREQERCTGFNADLVALGSGLNADVVVDEGHIPQYADGFTAGHDEAVRPDQLGQQPSKTRQAKPGG